MFNAGIISIAPTIFNSQFAYSRCVDSAPIAKLHCSIAVWQNSIAVWLHSIAISQSKLAISQLNKISIAVWQNSIAMWLHSIAISQSKLAVSQLSNAISQSGRGETLPHVCMMLCMYECHGHTLSIGTVG